MPAQGFIDLHMHSTASDGVLSPTDLMIKAHGTGVRTLALTDHDTMLGLKEAKAKADELGMKLIPGVEISTTTHGKSCHLLAYFESMDVVGEFAAFLQERLEARERRFEEMIEKFRKIGIALDAARVRRLAQGAAITRPHVARALVEQGVVQSAQEAFDKYIANGGPCYVAYEKLPTADTIGLVHKHGGVTSVAHPGNEKFTETELADLRKAGLDAVEVYHYDHDAEARTRYGRIADRLGLLRTGGSDFHGDNHRSFYTAATEGEGVPPAVREPLLQALQSARARVHG